LLDPGSPQNLLAVTGNGQAHANIFISTIAGFFSGSVVALLVFFIAILALAGGYDNAGGAEYVDSVLPVFM
jgi:hypothetical protein